MLRKKKLCVECGREEFIFSKGRCKACASRSYSTPRKTPLKREYKATGEMELFKEIWAERPHKSFLSGLPLGDELKPWMFAHILPKGRWPQLRLIKENIVLLTFKEHFLFDHGIQLHRDQYAEKTGCSWDKLYSLKEELTQKYS